mmetsp:Transcript_681/g.2266  ORF Transcript_681/g.2266 Transcript_681/m.2266 type:complete len:244 (+) Transcript_681:283-1014(+)
MSETVWSSLIAFIAGVPDRVRSAGERRRSETCCALERSSNSSGPTSSWRRLNSNSLRHIAAQFVVDASRESNKLARTNSSATNETMEELFKKPAVGQIGADISDMQSQSLLVSSWVKDIVPGFFRNLKRRSEEAKEELLEVEKLLPTPLLQSLQFTWEEHVEEEKISWFNRVFEVQRKLAGGVDAKLQKVLSSFNKNQMLAAKPPSLPPSSSPILANELKEQGEQKDLSLLGMSFNFLLALKP